ncbi:MAG TPA: hypothetical protein VFJ19_19725 [Nocardioidaceae bacterium]|nr:hypothetical protein [Nocardioidaceae bacterium]
MGDFHLPISVANTGTTACSLPPSKVSVVATVQGAEKHLAQLSTADRDGATPILSPGGTIDLRADIPNYCSASKGVSARTVPTKLSVDSREVAVVGALLPGRAAVCDEGALTYPPKPNEEDAGTGTYSPLQVTLDLPEQVASGDMLNYQVSLTNMSSKTFTFDKCPTYTEMGSVGGGGVSEETYTLNCSHVSSIKPGDSATFDMRFQLPSNVQGILKFAWLMNQGPSQSGTADVTK